MLVVRRARLEEVSSAMVLVFDVFVKYDAQYCTQEGVIALRHNISGDDAYLGSVGMGKTPLYLAILNGELVGVLGLDQYSPSIKLLYVKQGYHRQGIGTALFRYMLQDNPQLTKIDVSSFRCAVPFFESLGFKKTSSEFLLMGWWMVTPMRFRTNI